MTDVKEASLNNPNAADSTLAIFAKEAKMAKDEETLMKLSTHPGAGPKTHRILVS